MTKKEVTYIKWRDQGIIRACPYCGDDMKPYLNESKAHYAKKTNCGGEDCKAQQRLLHSKQLKEFYKRNIKIYETY